MAVAAERVQRPPESEIYGRSLSTIYRLGALAAGKVASEVVLSPEAEQVRVEFYTSVEEGFGTDEELGGGLEVRDFDTRPVIGGKVMSKDLKTAVSDMTEAGLVCAEDKYERESTRPGNPDRRFQPQLIRSRWDHHNAEIVDQMARGETDYNTRIVISPFPEEAAAGSGNAYWRGIGYVPSLRRGFVQLYHMSEDGLVTGSLSFDGSDREHLRELLCECGVDISETEVTDNWLQYAVTDTLSEEYAKKLALGIADKAGDPEYKKATNTVEVTGEHRAIMDTVFNESYVHVCESAFMGYQTPDTEELIFHLTSEAGHFNDRYKEALYRMRRTKEFTDDDAVVLHELLVYSTIEMMRALHLNEQGTGAGIDAAYLRSLDTSSFQHMLSGFGAEGARNNRTYSACGLSISLGESAQFSDNPQAAYGGHAIGEDKYGPRKFKCTRGHWNTRPRNKLIEKCQHKGCKGKVSC